MAQSLALAALATTPDPPAAARAVPHSGESPRRELPARRSGPAPGVCETSTARCRPNTGSSPGRRAWRERRRCRRQTGSRAAPAEPSPPARPDRCGNPPDGWPAGSAPRPPARSSQVPHHLQHPPQIARVKAAANPDRHPGAAQFNPSAVAGDRHRHKPRQRRPATLGTIPKLSPPSEKLIAMQPITQRHRRPARYGRVALGDNPRLLFCRPAPAPRHPGDHFHAPERVALRWQIIGQTIHARGLLSNAPSSSLAYPPQGGTGATLTPKPRVLPTANA